MKHTTDPRAQTGGQSGGVSRRALLAAGSLAGAGTALGALAVVAAQGGSTLTYDVACDGRTFILNRTSAPNELPRRGDTFIVNGKIYPAGTIERGLSGPDQPGSIGTWVCRGTFYVQDIMTQTPHVATTQIYLLDAGGSLVSEGLEGGIPVMRAVIGGTGAHAGAGGEVSEEEVGTNDTMIDFGVAQAPAPNIRFVFHLA